MDLLLRDGQIRRFGKSGGEPFLSTSRIIHTKVLGGYTAVHGGKLQGDRMATLQQQIAEKFLAQLAQSKEVSAEKVEKLRTTFSTSRKPKADDFVKIFTEPDHGDIK